MQSHVASASRAAFALKELSDSVDSFFWVSAKPHNGKSMGSRQHLDYKLIRSVEITIAHAAA